MRQFNYWHDPTPLWAFDRLRETRYVDHPYNDDEEDPQIDAADILNHPVENTDDPLLIPDFVESLDDQMAQGPLHAVCVPLRTNISTALTAITDLVIGVGSLGRMSYIRQNP